MNRDCQWMIVYAQDRERQGKYRQDPSAATTSESEIMKLARMRCEMNEAERSNWAAGGKCPTHQNTVCLRVSQFEGVAETATEHDSLKKRMTANLS